MIITSKYLFRFMPFALVIGLFSPLAVHIGTIGQADAAEQRTTESDIEKIRLEHTRQAAEWGLTEQEWARYEELKKGRQGILAPGLDPLTMLGIEAKSSAERKHYAQLQAAFEMQRIERVLAYQRAYDEAIGELTVGMHRIEPFSLNDRANVSRFRHSSRFSVLAAIDDCSECDDVIRKLISDGESADIFLIDSRGDDERIRHWAARLKIPADRVMDRTITLNHGTGIETDAKSLPVIDEQRQ